MTLQLLLHLFIFFNLCQKSESFGGREFAVYAVDYFQTYESVLQLGDCVQAAASGDGGRVTTEGFKYSGDVEFIDTRTSELKYQRLTTALDSTTRTMGGVSVGIDFLGLVSAEVEAKVTVTIKKKRNSLMMEANLDIKRGMNTLRRPFPSDRVIRDPNKCPFYLSEIIFGGKEKLVVQMELETSETKVDVEIKITVKILFFKISVTMRYSTTIQKGSGRAKVFRLSTYFQQKSKQVWSRSYTRDELTSAIRDVERAERAMNSLPKNLTSMSLSQLHHTYIFAKAIVGDVYKASVLTSQWTYKYARQQYLELKQTEAEIAEDIDTRVQGFPAATQQALQSLKIDVTRVKAQLEQQLKVYYTLTNSQLEALPNIYGADKAPGYYHRKHRKILPEEEFTVCQNMSISINGIQTNVVNRISLTHCSGNCTIDRNCNMFSFKPSTTGKPIKGTCTLFFGQPTCNTVAWQSDTDSIAVFVDRLPCSSSQLGLKGCVKYSYVQSEPIDLASTPLTDQQ